VAEAPAEAPTEAAMGWLWRLPRTGLSKQQRPTSSCSCSLAGARAGEEQRETPLPLS
jgi:hypothetical protein